MNQPFLLSSDRINWSIRRFDNSKFEGITWDGKQFVIVGSEGIVLTSSDGAVWSPQNPDSEDNLSDVVSNSSKLVAVGDEGTILTSENAEDWIKHNENTVGVDPFIDVIWANGRFIAIGNTSADSFVISSENGKDWASIATLEEQSLNGIAWNSDIFVAVGTGGTILTSPDAEIWTQQNSGISSKLTDVVWSNNQFVAIGLGGTIVTSEDGIHWNSQVSGTTGTLNRVIWGNNEFVTVGTLVEWPIKHPIILTSVDGEVWEQHISLDVLTNGTLYSVAWGNDQYMVLKDSVVCITSNWSDWSINESLTTITLQDVTWGANQFVVVGGDSGENSSVILTRAEGEGWIKMDSISKHALRGVTFNGSQFVVVGYGGTILRKLMSCECDIEPDGDVDGSDLAVFISTGVGISLGDFADEFGRINCPTF